jgi:DNA uptake protein ComE-like DNA-binding protein
MKKLKYWIRNFFGFSQRETNGFIVLFILLISILFVPPLVNSFYSPEKNYAKDKQALDSVIAQLNKDSVLVSRSTSKPFDAKNRIPIDPNFATIVQLESLFGKKIAQTIDHYRKKGGKFKFKSDLKKVYGMNEEIYTTSLSWILLPDQISFENKSTKVIYQKLSIDINKADSIQLEKLPSIGPVLASRIVKYRIKLGGYIDASQLLEVYGIKQEVYDLIKEQLWVAKDFIPVKLSMNDATYYELKNHPYIGGKLASSILKYRKANKSIASMEELINASLVKKDEALKLSSYFRF